jgi:hypothetical protein
MSVVRVVQEASLQAVAGLTMGALMDKFFEGSSDENNYKISDPITELAEVFIQLGANAMVVSLYYEYAKRLSSGTPDPTQGLTLVLCLVSSQPKLQQRCSKIARQILGLVDFSSSPQPPINPNKSGCQPTVATRRSAQENLGTGMGSIYHTTDDPKFISSDH